MLENIRPKIVKDPNFPVTTKSVIVTLCKACLLSVSFEEFLSSEIHQFK